MHSALTDRQRQDAYQRMQNGTAKIAIGTRSAVFAPVQNLGILIVDEEGERTYKSENAPRYHAVAVARKRCQTHHCPLLLASATPSIESYYYAKKGVYTLLELKKRYRNMPLPEVTVVDMNRERQLGNGTPFSNALIDAMQETLSHGKQVLLLLNRRGYHTMISCCSCNEPVYCPNCSVPMTYHKVSDQLMCHICSRCRKPVRIAVGNSSEEWALGHSRWKNSCNCCFRKQGCSAWMRTQLALDMPMRKSLQHSATRNTKLWLVRR